MLRIQVQTGQQRRTLEHAAGPLEFGRLNRPGHPRVVLDDPCVSRDQLRIQERPLGLLELENLSKGTVVYLDDGSTVAVQSRRQVRLPVRLTVGMTHIEIEVQEDPSTSTGTEGSWNTVDQPIRQSLAAGRSLSLSAMREDITPQTLAHWFETVISVQRAAAGSAEFYRETVRAVVDLVGLDYGAMLLARKQPDGTIRWEEAACYSGQADRHPEISRTVLDRVLLQKRTFYQGGEPMNITNSLMGVESVVASPVFGPEDDVVGVLYGLRFEAALGRRGIKPLEAQVVQLLAAAVGAGLARQQREAEAARLRVQFEQFFSPELASELERDPTLLEGRDREVTILFSDIRGFSRLSEQLGPADTFRLVGQVMERLAVHVAEFQGVLVNYVGDGLLAMWNAPADRPRHAVLACKAALKMLAELPALSEAWRGKLDQPLLLGIGINTGPARVGNAGSSRRFSYSPLGHTVNLASRVEGATKYLGVPIVITGGTQQQLAGELVTRRLCRARLPGIDSPVDLYELRGESADAQWLARKECYEQALLLYEQHQPRAAYEALAPAYLDLPPDVDPPGRLLLERLRVALQSDTYTPIWDFPNK
jgi:adenylate cyclase